MERKIEARPTSTLSEPLFHFVMDDAVSVQAGLRSLANDSLDKIIRLREDRFSGSFIQSVDARRKALVDCGSILHFQLTKLSLLAKENSLETLDISKEVLKCTNWLYSYIHSLPKALGATLFESIRKGISIILLDVASLCNSFLDEKLDSRIDGIKNQTFLVATGIAWKSTEIFDTLPLTNSLAVCSKLDTQKELIQDASREVAEILENPGNISGWEDLLDDQEDVQEFTSLEILVIKDILRLVKASVILFKKIGKMLNIIGNDEDVLISQINSLSLGNEQTKFTLMDEIPDAAVEIAENIDDLICLLETPLPLVEISSSCLDLSKSINSLVELAVGIQKENDDGGWFDKMKTQVENIVEALRVAR